MQSVALTGSACGSRLRVSGLSSCPPADARRIVRAARSIKPLPKRLTCSEPAAFRAELLGQSLGPMHSVSLPMVPKKRALRTRAQAADGDIVASKGTSSGYGGSLYPAVGAACLGSLLFGYHLGVVNGALEYVSRDLAIAGNTTLQGWVVSITLAGATIGSFTGGVLADKFGRTRCFQLDSVPLIVGALLSATATEIQAMLVGRFLAGLGIGITSAVIPLYIAEIAPTDIRGSLGSVNQLFICVGILLALIAGLPLADNPIWWRKMFTIAVVPAVLLVLGMSFAPESPRWLYQQGRKAEAEDSVRRLWGKSRVEQAMSEISDSSSSSSEEAAGWGELLSKRYRKVVSVGAMLFLFQQFAGINAVVYYSTSVFRQAGIKSDVAASALVSAANVFGTIVASSLMDKQGRKKLLTLSFLGMAASMTVLSLSQSWSALAPYAGPLAVGGTVAYILSFALGVGPVVGLVLPEIFASRIRAKALSVSFGVHWITNFLIGLYFLTFVNKFGISNVYLGFSAVCLLAVLYISGNLVETKGRSLEEIERELGQTA
ncbi:hypothetical protein R1sor_016451 [Riccia sorocarpa]|uniref:Major facilitator superfamily (MFS) profile domain-containing protein n=1 Tax=Riccia sorocarpa TaxID=122646 RepID=A0ABD3HHT4_9MARC